MSCSMTLNLRCTQDVYEVFCIFAHVLQTLDISNNAMRVPTCLNSVFSHFDRHRVS